MDFAERLAAAKAEGSRAHKALGRFAKIREDRREELLERAEKYLEALVVKAEADPMLFVGRGVAVALVDVEPDRYERVPAYWASGTQAAVSHAYLSWHNRYTADNAGLGQAIQELAGNTMIVSADFQRNDDALFFSIRSAKLTGSTA